MEFLTGLFGEFGASTALFLLRTSFIWIPVLLSVGIVHLWLMYKRAEFIKKQGSILLEIKVPKEVMKSPQAMELAMNSFYQPGGESTFIDRLFKGKTRAWFSLELVSIEGQIRFFIWTRPQWKNLIEAQIYAQYPGIEIYEVPDYTLPVSFDPKKIALWGCDFKLSKPDPYPIKTYVDYGMAMNPKEEEKIDPITAFIEFLGSVGKGQQLWFQIMIQAHKSTRKKPGTWFGTEDWKGESIREKKKLIKALEGRLPTPEEGIVISAVERSISKLPFETGIRGIYLAEKEHFNAVNISGLLGAFRQYSSNTLNGFKPTGWLFNFSYPWQDYKEIRQNAARQGMLDAYKRRSFFHAPYRSTPFILNTEELATIYHFPGGVSTTPSFSRVVSRKAEPPSNLPI